MKKLILTAVAVLFSAGAWADCSNPKSSSEDLQCMSNQIGLLKRELNLVYKKLYSQTDAKSELDQAQKAWLRYREAQCGNFTVADAGASIGQIAYDLDCQIELTKSRINYLQHITP